MPASKFFVDSETLVHTRVTEQYLLLQKLCNTFLFFSKIYTLFFGNKTTREETRRGGWWTKTQLAITISSRA